MRLLLLFGSRKWLVGRCSQGGNCTALSLVCYNRGMYINDEDDEYMTETLVDNDDLLADAHVHLPASANMLTRLRAMQTWLVRRRNEAELAVGMAVYALQVEAQEAESGPRPRRMCPRTIYPRSNVCR